MTEQELMTIPYAEFVNGLFVKPDDLAGKLMHAAVGMTGEAVEFMQATGREHEIEELGDFEFYYQAFYIHAPVTLEVVNSAQLCQPKTLAGAINQLVSSSHEIQDQIKKHWIYAKPYDQLTLQTHLVNCRLALETIYKIQNYTQEIILLHNRAKLIKRYPGATYTDAAAQARADKVES
jgi:hypothetical protein